MNLLWAFETLSGQPATVLQSMGSELRAQHSLGLLDIVYWLLVAAGSMLLTSWLGGLWVRQRTRRGYCRPQELFLDLCRIHGLNAADRRLLRQLATIRRLPLAAEVFLRPDCFSHPDVDRRLAHAQPRLARLHAELFDLGPLDECAPRIDREPAAEMLDTVSIARLRSLADTVSMRLSAAPPSVAPQAEEASAAAGAEVATR